VIGSFRIAWHSVFALIGMLAGSVVSIRCARYLVRDERIYPFAIAVVVGGLIGARVAHVTDNWTLYANDPVRALQFWGGGIGTMGAPIGSTISGFLAARWLRLPIGFMFDISVIGIALGEAIGRIGDIINGEHHSVPCTDLPWCVRYTHPNTLGQSTSVHPIGAYDGLLMLAIFALLYVYWRRVRGRPPESRVWLAYLLLLGGGRFLLSFLRTDPLFLDGLQQAQVLGLLYLGAGAVSLPLLESRAARLASVGRAQNRQKPLPNGVSDR
jgi:phosphatidylglycerol:prolipoprotein diacylglycerol transferase